MKITDSQVAAAYQIAKLVFDKHIKASHGVKVLTSEHGLNKATAGDFINDYKYLLEGRVFHRAMSASAMKYFIQNIYVDYGVAKLKNAIDSLRLHIEYFEGHYKITMHSMRSVADSFELLTQSPKLKDDFEKQFTEQIEKSLYDSENNRLKRLANASKIPNTAIVQSIVFIRNPDVVAESLARAKGTCECCHSPAPFLRAKDGTPYLEVHHKIMLADGGEDSIENAIAICPNCHRRAHFG